MKSIFLTGIAVLFLFSASAQLTIPNAGFENWTAAGSYENPVSWDSPNEVTSSLGKIVVEKEELYVHSGSYSALITVQSSLAGNLPGMLTLGDFSFDLLSMTATIEGGTPFTGRPETFSGWYQYDPQNNDICLLGAFLLKDNAGVWDTIAIAGFESTTSVQTWTQFEADFDYRSSETPTHMNIILLPTDRNNPQANSTLYIDDLSFSYPQSIGEANDDEIELFTDYTNEILSVQFQETLNYNVTLSDVNGRVLKSFSNSGSDCQIDMSGIPNGVYLLNISCNEKNQSIKTIW